MAASPNFLFFITDQHRADYLGCYGHPSLATPHIDSLAREGLRFERFYAASPICMPNRATLMTGRMPSLHGVRCNGIPLSTLQTTFTDLLRDAGYRTALVGKSHLQPFSEVPPHLTRPRSRAGCHEPAVGLREARKPVDGEGPYDQELRDTWLADPDAIRLPFYGFDQVELCTRHADRVGGHYWHWLTARHPSPEKLIGPDNALPHDVKCPQAWRTAMPEELYSTSYIAERSAAYLAEHARRGNDKPFFLCVSFPDPHHPFTPPGRYWDMYGPEDSQLPASFHAPAESLPPHVAWAHRQRDGGTAQRDGPAVFAVTEREAREAIALSCGMIRMIDDAVGRVLATLREAGLEQDTVIVFTSDHGDFLGDHQMLLKGPIHYQSLLRVPFIWADPEAPQGKTRDDLAGTLDIAATILDRAGIEPFTGLQGRSLIGQSPAPDGLLIEEDGQRTYLGLPGPARLRTVMTKDHRLTLYHDVAWAELYDLRNDPHEIRNLWDDPSAAAVRSDLLERLARLQMGAADRSPLPIRQG